MWKNPFLIRKIDTITEKKMWKKRDLHLWPGHKNWNLQQKKFLKNVQFYMFH